MSGSFDDVSSSSDADDVPSQAPDTAASSAEVDSSSAAAAAATAKDASVTVKRRNTRKVGAVLLCHNTVRYPYFLQVVSGLGCPSHRSNGRNGSDKQTRLVRVDGLKPSYCLYQAVAAKISAARALAQRLAEENSAAVAEARATAEGSNDIEQLHQCAHNSSPVDVCPV